MSKRPVYVIGSAKGGTSMTAGVLRILGVDFGDRLGEWNNHSEDLPLVEAVHAANTRKFNSLMQTSLRGEGYFGLKHPSFVQKTQYLTFLLEKSPKAKWVFIQRDTSAITLNRLSNTEMDKWGVRRRLDEMSRIHTENAYALTWMTSHLDSLGHDNILLLSYEKCLLDPREALIMPLIHFLKIGVPFESLNWAETYVKESPGYQDINEYLLQGEYS